MGLKSVILRLLRAATLAIISIILGIIMSGNISISWLLGLLIFYLDMFIVNKQGGI